MWVEQHPQFGLGNFINLTPTLQELHARVGERVPCVFANPVFAKAFEDAPFLEVVERGEGERLFGSDLINSKVPDWQYVYRRVIGGGPIPHTYVDEPDPIPGEYAVFIRGAGNTDPKYLAMKDPGTEAYRKIREMIELPVVLVGGFEDMLWCREMLPFVDEHEMGDIRRALARIRGARFIVANDTGLYHAAAAMRARLFVMWERTRFIKNRAPENGNITWSMGHHAENFQKNFHLEVPA